MTLHLHVNGEPIRVLHLDKDKCEALIVFRETTQKIPLSHLVKILDNASLEDVEALQELMILSGVGVGGDCNACDRASLVPAIFSDSDIFAPLSVGDLSKKPDGKDVNSTHG